MKPTDRIIYERGFGPGDGDSHVERVEPMTVSPSPEQLSELELCRACGAPCRVETFGGGVHVTPTDLWLCSKHSFFGGDCPSDISYFNAEAWNAAQAAMTDPPSPERIWLIYDKQADEPITWADNPNPYAAFGEQADAAIEYIRADALESAQSEIARLTELLKDARRMMYDEHKTSKRIDAALKNSQP